MFNGIELISLNDRIWYWSNLKAFKEKEINIAYMMKFDLDWNENIMRKGEKNLITSIFNFPHNVFKRGF